MGRPKLEPLLNPLQKEKEKQKLPTFSEKYEEDLKRQLFENDNVDEESVGEIILKDKMVHHKSQTGEWDVPLGEEIKYFDPELSYEITKYKPITMDQGLDFDPEPFREAAATFEKDGCYTKYPKGCKPFRDYWTEQLRRMVEGYEVNGYRITGDHYYFLNFYRMETVPDDEKSGSGRNESFPSFFSKQYEWFHYVEMAEKLHKDACALKSRGVGWSEMTAAMAVRPYTTNRKYRTLLTCSAQTKLDPLKDKCWLQLNWLNRNTNTGLKHLRQKKDNYDTKRASMVDSEGNEYGWLSEIDSVVADTADKIRGDRVDRLVYEEAGSNKQLAKSWIQGESLVALGGKHFGIRIALGTGGDDMALEGLADMFRTPEAFNILPFKNYDTDDGKPEITAFFLPAHKFAIDKKYLDSRGVTNYIEFKKYYEKQRNKLEGQNLLDEMAEHCFTPREALNKHGASVFDSVALSERLIQLKVQKLGLKPIPMQLLWDKTKGENAIIAKESPNSKLLVVEPPLKGPDGLPYKNLYVAGIDAIDQGTSDSASYSDVSDFCVVIMKRVFGMEEPKIVAMYKDRPSDIRAAYDLTMKLLTWYNCKAMLEYTKISIIQYFTNKNKAGLFMDRPELGSGSKPVPKRMGSKRLIGVPGTPAYINHGIELIQGFVNEFWHTIDYEEIVEQLLNYSYENKRKFDIVAALQMVLIGDEALTGVNPSTVKTVKSQWKDIGYYRDENGYLRYGVIPDNNKPVAKWHS